MTHAFRVWAPSATGVDLITRIETVEELHRMEPSGRGWFQADVAGAGSGTRYAFSLDGGPPRADPRSDSQRDGFDGFSTVVDHGAFEWTDEQWRGVRLSAAVIYELHVGTFTPRRTFDGVVEKLPHLVELGIDAIELMPVNTFPGTRGWGYDGVALFAPQESYGGSDGLKRLVDACHAAGIAVILDVVYNHFGPSGNYLQEFGPYFTDKYSTPWGWAVNLDDRGSDDVRRFVLDNVRHWFESYHVDGLRLDAVHALIDTSATHILEEISSAVRALEDELGRPLSVIAESDLNDPRVVTSPEFGGYGIDAQWSDDFHHALHALLTGERDGYYADFGTIDQLATALRRGFVFAGEYSAVRGRRHGRAPVGLRADRFLGYAQNHDQVGNRANGERTSHLLSVDRLKIAAAMVMVSPFVPLLFMGEEWAATSPFQYFTEHEDPELARAVTDGRRREFESFGWEPADVPDPQAVATFERSTLDWSELAGELHREMLDWHRELIRLRRSYPELTDGAFDSVNVDVDASLGRLTLRRGRISLLVNLGVSDWPIAEMGKAFLTSPGQVDSPDREAISRLPPDGLAVFI